MEATPRRPVGDLNNGATPVPFKTPKQRGDGDGDGGSGFEGELSMDDLRNTPGRPDTISKINAHSEAQLGLAWEMYGNSSPRTASPKRRAQTTAATATAARTPSGVPRDVTPQSAFVSPQRIVDRIRAINPNFRYENGEGAGAVDTPHRANWSGLNDSPFSAKADAASPFALSPFVDPSRSPFSMAYTTPGLLRTSRRLQQYFGHNNGTNGTDHGSSADLRRNALDKHAGGTARANPGASPRKAFPASPSLQQSGNKSSAGLAMNRTPPQSTNHGIFVDKGSTEPFGHDFQRRDGNGRNVSQADAGSAPSSTPRRSSSASDSARYNFSSGTSVRQSQQKGSEGNNQFQNAEKYAANRNVLVDQLQRSVGEVRSTPESTHLAQRLIISQLVQKIDRLATPAQAEPKAISMLGSPKHVDRGGDADKKLGMDDLSPASSAASPFANSPEPVGNSHRLQYDRKFEEELLRLSSGTAPSNVVPHKSSEPSSTILPATLNHPPTQSGTSPGEGTMHTLLESAFLPSAIPSFRAPSADAAKSRTVQSTTPFAGAAASSANGQEYPLIPWASARDNSAFAGDVTLLPPGTSRSNFSPHVPSQHNETSASPGFYASPVPTVPATPQESSRRGPSSHSSSPWEHVGSVGSGQSSAQRPRQTVGSATASVVSSVDLWVQAAMRQLLLKITHVANHVNKAESISANAEEDAKTHAAQYASLFSRLTRYLQRMRLLLRPDGADNRLDTFKKSRYFGDGGIYDLLLVGLRALVRLALPRLARDFVIAPTSNDPTFRDLSPASQGSLSSHASQSQPRFWSLIAWFCASAAEILSLIRSLLHHHLAGCLDDTLWKDFILCGNELRGLVLRALAGKSVESSTVQDSAATSKTPDSSIDGGHKLFFAAAARCFHQTSDKATTSETEARAAMLNLLFEVSPSLTYSALRQSLRHFGWISSEAKVVTTLIQSSAYAAELVVVPALFDELLRTAVATVPGAASGLSESRPDQLHAQLRVLPELGYRGSLLLALGTLLQRLQRVEQYSGTVAGETLFSPRRLQALALILLHPNHGPGSSSIHLSAMSCRRDQILAAWTLGKCGSEGLALLSKIATAACRHARAHSPRRVHPDGGSHTSRSTVSFFADTNSSLLGTSSFAMHSSTFIATAPSSLVRLAKTCKSQAKKLNHLPSLSIELDAWLSDQPHPPATTRVLAAWGMCEAATPGYSVPFSIDRQSTREQLRHGDSLASTFHGNAPLHACTSTVHSAGGSLSLFLHAVQPPASAGADAASCVLLDAQAGVKGHQVIKARALNAAAASVSTRHAGVAKALDADDAALLSMSSIAPRTHASPVKSRAIDGDDLSASTGFGSSIGVGGRSIFMQEQHMQSVSVASPAYGAGGTPSSESRPHYFLNDCKPDLYQELARARCSVQILAGVLDEIHPSKRNAFFHVGQVKSEPASRQRAGAHKHEEEEKRSSSFYRRCDLRLARFCVINSPATQTLAVLNATEATGLVKSAIKLPGCNKGRGSDTSGSAAAGADRSSAPLESYLSDAGAISDSWLLRRDAFNVALTFSAPALVAQLHTQATEATVSAESVSTPLQSRVFSTMAHSLASPHFPLNATNTPVSHGYNDAGTSDVSEVFSTPGTQRSFQTASKTETIHWGMQEDVLLHVLLHDVSRHAALAALAQLAVLPGRCLSPRTLQALMCMGALELIPRFCRGPTAAEIAASSLASTATATSFRRGSHRDTSGSANGNGSNGLAGMDAAAEVKKQRAELRAEVFNALASAPLLSSKLFAGDNSYAHFLARCLRSPYYKVRVASAGLLRFYTAEVEPARKQNSHDRRHRHDQVLPSLVAAMLDNLLPDDVALQTMMCVPGGASVVVDLLHSFAVRASPARLLAHALHFAPYGANSPQYDHAVGQHPRDPRLSTLRADDNPVRIRRQRAAAVRKRVDLLVSSRSFRTTVLEALPALPSTIVLNSDSRAELFTALRGIIHNTVDGPSSHSSAGRAGTQPRRQSVRGQRSSLYGNGRHGAGCTGTATSVSKKHSKASPLTQARVAAVRAYGSLARRVAAETAAVESQSSTAGNFRAEGGADVNKFDLRTIFSFLDRTLRSCAAGGQRRQEGSAAVAAECARQIARFGDAGELLLISTLTHSIWNNIATMSTDDIVGSATVQASLLPGVVMLPSSSALPALLVRLGEVVATISRLRLRQQGLHLHVQKLNEDALRREIGTAQRLAQALARATAQIYLGPGRHDSERCVVVDDDALLAGARRLWLLGGGVSAALSDIALTLTSPREGLPCVLEYLQAEINADATGNYHHTRRHHRGAAAAAAALAPNLEALLQRLLRHVGMRGRTPTESAY